MASIKSRSCRGASERHSWRRRPLTSRKVSPRCCRASSGPSRRSHLQNVYLDHLILHVAADLVEVELLGPKLA
eukprot:6664448-Heterocapsa_arctica.AAC.1